MGYVKGGFGVFDYVTVKESIYFCFLKKNYFLF